MKESERLRDAKTLIDAPEKWIQHRYCDDFKNDLNYACKFCSVGAVLAVRGETVAHTDFNSTSDYLHKALTEIAPESCGIAEYNDNHSHEEVMVLFDKAIELAESEGN